MPDEPPALAVGTVLTTRYRISRTIGAGGMATVYQALDATTGKLVAIKLLNPSLSGSIGVDRFLREIAVTSRLRHPLIVPILDSGTHDGSPFFVMPFVEGESLRDRLRREKQLPLEMALRIAHDVLSALSTAHAQGIVHRDIKPPNILLQDGRAIVADFGIARACSAAAADRLTESGIAIGTPGYMSPEQASGEAHLDARTDVYAVGCVLFEMLAGEPPYAGPTPQSIVAKQLSLPVPSLAVVRSTIPSEVDRLLQRALAKSPADRLATASAFGSGVERIERGLAAGTMKPAVPRRRRAWVVAAVALVMVIGGALTLAVARDAILGDAALGDTTAYAVFPLTLSGTAPNAPSELTEVLQDALSRWGGVRVVDPARVRETIASRGTPSSERGAAQFAREMGAGRFLLGSLVREGDSLRARVELRDANSAGTLLAQRGLLLPRQRARAESSLTRLADDLLFRDAAVPEEPSGRAERSLPARQAFAAGQSALALWNLTAADSQFQRALSFDRNYAQAHLYLAAVREWSDAEATPSSVNAEQAELRIASLSQRERGMAMAVVAQAKSDYGRACPLWRRLTSIDTLDALTWFGSGHCQAADFAVVRDPKSPSSWRFRTSYHRALQDYRRAFRLLPPMLASFREESYESLRALFFAGGNGTRGGRALRPDSTLFEAHPTWAGDSLNFVPYPFRGGVAQRLVPMPAVTEAVRRQRIIIRQVASNWVTSFPTSADARHALAIALGMLGDPSAVDTLAIAQRLARTADERLRVAGSLVWMELTFALAVGDTARLERARRLADSLLSAHVPNATTDAHLMAGLAALTGRADAAARYAQEPRAADALYVPPLLRNSAAPLLVYSAMGGPPDSLTALEERTLAIIDRSVPPADRSMRRNALVIRAATMAFPAHRSPRIALYAQQGDWLLDLQADLVRHHTLPIRRMLAEVSRARAAALPEALTLDALYPEAELLAELGDTAAAAAWLDPTLHALPQASPSNVASPLHAASLVRAMALRARLATTLGDRPMATRWSRAVALLWSSADAFLQPVVSDMKALAR